MATSGGPFNRVPRFPARMDAAKKDAKERRRSDTTMEPAITPSPKPDLSTQSILRTIFKQDTISFDVYLRDEENKESICWTHSQ